MSVTVRNGTILLQGPCGVEDAEALLSALLSDPAAAVDLSGCASAHTAVIQLLLSSRRPIARPPPDALLALWLQPPAVP